MKHCRQCSARIRDGAFEEGRQYENTERKRAEECVKQLVDKYGKENINHILDRIH